MACGICPGFFSVWRYGSDPDGDVEGAFWNQIYGVDSWTIDANVTEATKKRNASTGGLAVKFCEDVVDYSASVTVTLCESNWVFCQILGDANANQLGVGRTGWWFFSWGSSGGSATAPISEPGATQNLDISAFDVWRLSGEGSPPVHQAKGVLLYGTVAPGGFGGDNTGTDVMTMTFTLNILAGPILPSGSPEPCSL